MMLCSSSRASLGGPQVSFIWLPRRVCPCISLFAHTPTPSSQHWLPPLAPALCPVPQCVELKPDWAKGYSRLGAAHHGLGNFQDAVQALEKGEGSEGAEWRIGKSRRPCRRRKTGIVRGRSGGAAWVRRGGDWGFKVLECGRIGAGWRLGWGGIVKDLRGSWGGALQGPANVTCR